MHTIGPRPSTSLRARQALLSNSPLGTARALLTTSAWASPCWRRLEGHPPGRASRPSPCRRPPPPLAAFRTGSTQRERGRALVGGCRRNRPVFLVLPIRVPGLFPGRRNARLLPRPDALARRAPLLCATASDAAFPGRRPTRRPSSARARHAGCRSPPLSGRSAGGHAPPAAGGDTDAARALPAQC